MASATTQQKRRQQLSFPATHVARGDATVNESLHKQDSNIRKKVFFLFLQNFTSLSLRCKQQMVAPSGSVSPPLGTLGVASPTVL